VCRQLATYHWKALDESYNFALDRTSIRGLLAKLWGSKVAGIPVGAISGVPGEKSHLDAGPVERCRVYYKGEGGGFPQVRAVVSFVCLCCPWFVLAPKVFQLCTNHLCVGCVQAHVSEWNLSTLPSPIPELQHAPLPLKVLWARECAPIPPPSDVLYFDSLLSLARNWECIIISTLYQFYKNLNTKWFHASYQPQISLKPITRTRLTWKL